MPTSQPTLKTARLLLRPFTQGDAESVELLAGAKEIAKGMPKMPHPYPKGAAESWIAAQPEQFAKGISVRFAITHETQLVGHVGLNMAREDQRGELNYWIGARFQGFGYATEAARAIVDFGFQELGLNRIHAQHFSWNVASGRVLAKIGLMHEGKQRQHVVGLDGRPEDRELWGLLKAEWEHSQN